MSYIETPGLQCRVDFLFPAMCWSTSSSVEVISSFYIRVELTSSFVFSFEMIHLLLCLCYVSLNVGKNLSTFYLFLIIMTELSPISIQIILNYNNFFKDIVNTFCLYLKLQHMHRS